MNKSLASLAMALYALMVATAPVHATTFYSGLDLAITDSTLASPECKTTPCAPLTIARPSFGTWTADPFTGARLTRLAGTTGTPLVGVGGTPAAVWGADARHHYSKDQPWSADEQYYWLENNSANGPSKVIFDSTGTVKWVNKSTMTPYCACLDSSYEIRMHPRYANIVVGWIKKKGSAYNKLIWWTLDSCLTKRSWVIPMGGTDETRRDSANFGLISEGTVSDDGRWIVLGTSYDRCPRPGDTSPAELAKCEAARVANQFHDDTLVVVDMMYPQNRTGDLVAPDTLGGRIGAYYTVPRLPAAFSQDPAVSPKYANSNGTIGNINISTKGSFVYVKYEGVPEYGRVFHRGTSAGADTSVLTLFPHAMAAKGLRPGPAAVWDSTLGWVAAMSHADMNETTSGVEVVAGHARETDDGLNNISQYWSESTATGDGVHAGRDSGGVIMVELATGLHRHVSAGSKVTGITPTVYDNEDRTYEAEGQHSSGRAVQMRGWHFVSYAYSPHKSGFTRPMRGELAAWKLDGNFSTTHPSHTVIRFGQHRSSESPYRNESHFVPSPTGRRGMFVSDWEADGQNGVTGDSKSFLLDARTTGTKTHYIATSVSVADSASSGAHPSHPTTFARWNRLANANNGSDVVTVLAAGTHQGFPNPAWAPTGGKRYYVYGPSMTPPYSVTLGTAGAATLTQSGVSIRGVNIGGDFRLIAPATFDSVTHFTSADRFEILGADRNVISDGTATGSSIVIGGNSSLTTDNRTAKNTIARMNFPSLTAAGDQTPIRIGSSVPPRYVDSLTYTDNKHVITNTSATASSWANDHLMRSNLTGNKFSIKQTQTPSLPAVFFRDSSAGNVFRRDTILAYGAGANRIAWATNLGGAPALQNTSINSWLDSSYVASRNGPAIDFSGSAMKGWNVTRTVAVSSGGQAARVGFSQSGLVPIGPIGKNYIGHNTFASDHRASGPNALTEMGVLGFDGMKTATDSVRLTNNLIYSFRAGGVTTDTVSGVGYNVIDADTTNGNVSKLRRFFISNWNAYGVYPMGSTPGDKAISYARNTGLVFAKPGASTAWNTLFPGRDAASVYGSPGFDRGGPDSTFGLTSTGGGTAFDPAISPLSIAVGGDTLGNDIGAVSAPGVAIAQVAAPWVFISGALDYVDTAYVYISNVGTDSLRMDLGTSTAPGTVTVSWDPAMSPLVLGPGDTGRMVIALTAGSPPGSYRVNYSTNEVGNPTRAVEMILGVPGQARVGSLEISGPGVTIGSGSED